MKEERKLQKAKIDLMRNPKFALLSGILMVGSTSVAEGVPTAYTNGRDEVYGREFVKSLDEAELAFVVAHECYHKMYRHLISWEKLVKEDAALANIAMDHVVNLALLELDPQCQFIRMPIYKDGPKKGERMGVADPRFKDMSTKQVFDILKKEQEDEGNDEGEEGDDETDEPGDRPTRGKQPGKKPKPTNRPAPPSFDDHDHEGAQQLGEKEKEELARDIDEAIRQGLLADKIKGNKAGTSDRELAELMRPKLDWREVLREYVKSVCNTKDTSSWRKVNRKFLSDDVLLPSLIGERIGHVVVAVDTSGSIGGPELTAFLTEVQGIATEVHPECVDLLYWDSRVAAHEEYRDGAVELIAQSTKPKGGGGTEPSCVSRWLADNPHIRPEVIIVLTDGYVGNDWGDGWTAPLLWVITHNRTAAPTHGQAVHMESV